MSPEEEEVCRLKIELVEVKKEAEIEMLKKEAEIEMLKKEAEIEMLKKEAGIEMLKMNFKQEMENLKQEIAAANWTYFQSFKELHMRQFIQKFLDKNLCNFRGNKVMKFAQFAKAKRNEQILKEWRFDSPDVFVDAFSELSTSLNKTAHPSFSLSETLIVPVKMFTDTEFRVLGFLWETYKLPIHKFKVSYPDKSEEGVAVYKDSEKTDQRLC
ncbi:hypothetical protein ABEB36_014365 [Hypothenemus hampei]|uniref:Uncharacterized protein n=1 Tax=Hypothenemus hampei TaxID=57062 RepID=A0ABD1E495_HYPHA